MTSGSQGLIDDDEMLLINDRTLNPFSVLSNNLKRNIGIEGKFDLYLYFDLFRGYVNIGLL